jgi:hypothetical protein
MFPNQYKHKKALDIMNGVLFPRDIPDQTSKKPFYTLYMVEGNCLRYRATAHNYEEMRDHVAQVPVGEIWMVRDSQGYDISMAFDNCENEEDTK